MIEKPNVLILMSDEHRSDVAGFAGDPVVRTPTMDWLAQSGVVFENAYTPAPICVPARQSIMAGQYPRRTGCEQFHHDLSPDYMTYARRFTQYGYDTACAGKLHHRGPDQMQGWMRRIGGDTKLNEHFTDRIETSNTRNKYASKWSDAKEIARAGVGVGPHQQDDAYTLQGALDFIRQFFVDTDYDQATPAQPLLLKVSFVRPHYPYFTDRERFEYYLNRVEPHAGQTLFDHPCLSNKAVMPGVDASDRDIRRAVAAYYGMIDALDHDFGTVLDALRFAGQDLDDWVIIYLSDHGEMLGEHNVWEKFKFFEGSAKVPLIIRWPKGFEGGRVCTENVNLCDIFATLCELCNIPVPEGLDSRSLKPLLRGHPEAAWDNVTYSQFQGTDLMIKRDALKYLWFGPDIPEVLFDLERDPQETTNVIGESRYRDALQGFRAECSRLGFRSKELSEQDSPLTTERLSNI